MCECVCWTAHGTRISAQFLRYCESVARGSAGCVSSLATMLGRSPMGWMRWCRVMMVLQGRREKKKRKTRFAGTLPTPFRGLPPTAVREAFFLFFFSLSDILRPERRVSDCRGRRSGRHHRSRGRGHGYGGGRAHRDRENKKAVVPPAGDADIGLERRSRSESGVAPVAAADPSSPSMGWQLQHAVLRSSRLLADLQLTPS